MEENRAKGAFYTPKEIVQYMCQESLIEYLSTNLSDEDKDDVELLIRHNVVSESLQSDSKRAVAINDLLKRVKICDPAIGSGAFPMGLLKEIFECRRFLSAPMGELNFYAAQIKKEIIQNNIYGVDIEPGAVDIARLRFWLSLVVDEEEPQPLPNLDYKIMQGNSLLERFDDINLSRLVSADKTDAVDLMITEQRQLGFGEGLARIEQPQLTLTVFDSATKAELQNLIEIYFDPEEYEQKTGVKHDKAELKNQINNMVDGKIHAHIFAEKKRLATEVKRYEKKWRDAGVTDFSKLDQKSKEYKNGYKPLKDRLDSLDKSEARLLDLQDTTDRPYFLWHLWFKDVFDEGGFDIFIGNPPYIQLQKLGADTAEYEKAGFQTFARTGDIYCLFYELGNELLKKGGTLCYITSNSWMKTKYGEELRIYFSENANPLKLLNFEDTKIFQTATVETNIILLTKQNFEGKLKAVAVREDYRNEIPITDYFLLNSIELEELDSEGWIILSKEEFAIKKHIESVATPLREFDLQINFGIKTGFNKAFLIPTEVKEDLVSKDEKNLEIIKPILRGRDLDKYLIRL